MKRESIAVIEKLVDEIPHHGSARVKVHGITLDALNILDGLLGVIGKVYEVVHYRKPVGQYDTYIVGSNFDIIVRDALTSGYVGTGSNGLVSVLKKVGVDEDQAKKFVNNKRVDGEHYDDAKIMFSFL